MNNRARVRAPSVTTRDLSANQYSAYACESNGTVLFLGSLPPPRIGPTLATEVLLESPLKHRVQLIHLDTSDHREICTLGVLDIVNIYLALRTYAVLLWHLIWSRPRIVYIPISQTTIGYMRDSIYILLSKIFRRRVVCHLRGGNFRNWLDIDTGWFVRSYVRAVHSLVDSQIVLGECLRPMFDGILPRERIFVVPNGKDVEIPERTRQSCSLNVLFLANMMRTKGVLEALYAAGQVSKQVPDVTFVFAGAWCEDDVKHEVTRFLESHTHLSIKWVGPVTGVEKYQLLADADVFLFPTYYPPEGHPWVIVEAMAAGLPIISSDQGAIRESVIEGFNGFLVERQNVKQIVQKVQQLIEDSALRVQMGKNSRRLYLKEYTQEAMVERMIQVFDEVMSPSPEMATIEQDGAINESD